MINKKFHMNLSKKSLVYGLILISVVFFSLSFQKHDDFVKETSNFASSYRIDALSIPDALDFCGESMPLNVPDISEKIDRELLVNTYWQSNALLLFKRSNKYFPIIEPILKSYGIPDDFKYLALIESGLMNVTSPAGAKGFWQIMKSTGKEYGLEINSNVDERYNLILSTQVACQYLSEAKSKFGSWTLAAAAYNAGMQGIDKELKRQSVNGYYDLLLGEETGRYIFRIVALKEILNHPKRYGFNFESSDLYSYAPTYTVEVDTAVADFVYFAKQFGINYKQLKIHNPWLREKFLNNKSRKKYSIEIPDYKFYNN